MFGVFSYSHFFLLSRVGGTNVTAEFVNLIEVRDTVTQATTHNHIINSKTAINILLC